MTINLAKIEILCNSFQAVLSNSQSETVVPALAQSQWTPEIPLLVDLQIGFEDRVVELRKQGGAA